MNQKKSLEERALSVSEQGFSLVVKTNEQNFNAAGLLKTVQLMQKEVCKGYDDIIAQCYRAHKASKAKKDEYFLPLKKAEGEIKRKIAYFCEDQEILRRKEEDRLRKIAQKKEDDLKAKAAEALKKGDEKKAEKYTAKATEIPIPTVAPKFEKPDNISFVTRYRAEVINQTLIPKVLNGIILLIPDMKTINKLAHDSKGLIRIPGIRIIAEKTVSGRTA